MNKCKFFKAWVGLCSKECEKDYCEEHSDIQCCGYVTVREPDKVYLKRCENRATQTCSIAVSLVCGYPICNECEHLRSGHGRVDNIKLERERLKE